MSSMQHIQSLFMDAIFKGQDNNPAIGVLGGYLLASEALDPYQQIAIYRNSVIGGLCTALAQIYPVCRKLVGDAFFDFMATAYIEQHPSTSPDTGDYGEQLSDFIATFKPAESLVYLPDVARLEWAWHRAFHAADHDGLDMTRLARLDGQQQASLVFTLPPGSTLIISSYPIDRIWLANQDDNETDDVINLDQGGIRLLVWRQDYTMRIDTLSAHEWQFLDAIKQHQNFVQACNSLSRHPQLDITSLLARCIQQGWIADFCQET